MYKSRSVLLDFTRLNNAERIVHKVTNRHPCQGMPRTSQQPVFYSRQPRRDCRWRHYFIQLSLLYNSGIFLASGIWHTYLTFTCAGYFHSGRRTTEEEDSRVRMMHERSRLLEKQFYSTSSTICRQITRNDWHNNFPTIKKSLDNSTKGKEQQRIFMIMI